MDAQPGGLAGQFTAQGRHAGAVELVVAGYIEDRRAREALRRPAEASRTGMDITGQDYRIGADLRQLPRSVEVFQMKIRKYPQAHRLSLAASHFGQRSEEHTSELQSR